MTSSSSSRQEALTAALLVALSLLSLFFTYDLLTLVLAGTSISPPTHTPTRPALAPDLRTYSFVGDDFPEYLSLPPSVGNVLMQAEDSAHYAPSHPLSEQEWLQTSPPGTGLTVQPSPPSSPSSPSNASNVSTSTTAALTARPFFISTFHQLHCLRYLRNSLARRSAHPKWGHLQHCLTYLREWALCDADVTLERAGWEDAVLHGREQWVGAVHVCRDWEGVYEEVGRAWGAWKEAYDQQREEL